LRVKTGAFSSRPPQPLLKATGFEAKTIHRLLEVDPRGRFQARRRDEASMVDVMAEKASRPPGNAVGHKITPDERSRCAPQAKELDDQYAPANGPNR
jgi:hypothetical protein